MWMSLLCCSFKTKNNGLLYRRAKAAFRLFSLIDFDHKVSL